MRRVIHNITLRKKALRIPEDLFSSFPFYRAGRFVRHIVKNRFYAFNSQYPFTHIVEELLRQLAKARSHEIIG